MTDGHRAVLMMVSSQQWCLSAIGDGIGKLTYISREKIASIGE